MNVDDLPHFFVRCLKVKEFWLHWFNWWESLSGIVIRNSQVIEECNSDVMQVLNFCLLYAKYYIYIQRLFSNNTLDLYACLNQLKQALKTEEKICKTNNKKENSPNTTLSMRIYKAIMKILYVIMHLRLCIYSLK